MNKAAEAALTFGMDELVADQRFKVHMSQEATMTPPANKAKQYAP
jgi:hypothetical protein